MNPTLKEIEKELIRELKMREKVWQKIPGTENFKDLTHQRRYDILKHLLEIVEHCPLKKWEELRNLSLSAKELTQYSLGF